jgi:anti-sigma factor RsiW
MNHLSAAQLSDFVHGELSPANDALAHAHLADCGVCRAEYDAEIALGEALRAAARDEELPFPSIIKAVVWERIREMPPSPAQRIQAWLRPLVAVSATAAVVLGAWFASPYAPHGANPTVDASYYLEAHAAQSGDSLLSEPAGSTTLETSMEDGTGAVPATLAEAVDAVR